jgi:hypothetical protein
MSWLWSVCGWFQHRSFLSVCEVLRTVSLRFDQNALRFRGFDHSESPFPVGIRIFDLTLPTPLFDDKAFCLKIPLRLNVRLWSPDHSDAFFAQFSKTSSWSG